MPTRNVVLTDHQDEFVNKLVAAGLYQNASEVLREGLRLVETQHAENKVRLQALRRAIQAGEDDIRAGRFVDLNVREDIERIFGRVTAGSQPRRKRNK